MYDTANLIIRNFNEQARLRTVLENPVVSNVQKKQLILLAANETKGSYFEQFVDLLLSNNRESYLYLILLKYMDLYREQQHIFKATVTSAATLDQAVVARLSTLVEKKRKGKLELELKIDPTIVGGFILDLDNTRWDASVRRQLQQIKNELITK
jgi:F-type H+-transporting ATPase subunit delta